MSEVSEIVLKCQRIAKKAHYGQIRKFGYDKGKPYIIHPKRVASQFNDIICTSVAYLHDTIEDTTVTAEDLRGLEIQDVIINAVEALTRREGESYLDFVLRAKANQHARMVKIADIEDNMISLKEGSLKDKYRMAIHILKKPDAIEIEKASNEWFDSQKASMGNIPNWNMEEYIKRGFLNGCKWALRDRRDE